MLEAEEIATIIPIPETVVDDADFNVWGELKPALAEAVAQVLDAAVFGGINKPASWPAAIVPAARAAGNTVELGSATAAEGGVVDVTRDVRLDRRDGRSDERLHRSMTAALALVPPRSSQMKPHPSSQGARR